MKFPADEHLKCKCCWWQYNRIADKCMDSTCGYALNYECRVHVMVKFIQLGST